MKNTDLEKKFLILKSKEIMSTLKLNHLREKHKTNEIQDIDLQNAEKKHLELQTALNEAFNQLQNIQYTYNIDYDAELTDANGNDFYQNFTEIFITTIFCDIDTTRDKDFSNLENFDLLLSKIIELLLSRFNRFRINKINRINNG